MNDTTGAAQCDIFRGGLRSDHVDPVRKYEIVTGTCVHVEVHGLTVALEAVVWKLAGDERWAVPHRRRNRRVNARVTEGHLATNEPVGFDIFQEMLAATVSNFRVRAAARADDGCTVPEIAALFTELLGTGKTVTVKLPEEVVWFLACYGTAPLCRWLLNIAVGDRRRVGVVADRLGGRGTCGFTRSLLCRLTAAFS